MKKLLLLCACVILLGSVSHSAPQSKITVKGWIIDNACAAQHKADIASYVEVHDMSCARTCGKDSGFSIYSGGRFYTIVKGDTQKIINYFGADFNNDTKVIITLKRSGRNYSVTNIKAWK